MTSAMEKRLDTLQAAIPVAPCNVCDRWPAILVRHQAANGTYTTTDLGGWPLDTLTCPACGRTPRLSVEIQRYEPARAAA